MPCNWNWGDQYRLVFGSLNDHTLLRFGPLWSLMIPLLSFRFLESAILSGQRLYLGDDILMWWRWLEDPLKKIERSWEVEVGHQCLLIQGKNFACDWLSERGSKQKCIKLFYNCEQSDFWISYWYFRRKFLMSDKTLSTTLSWRRWTFA